MKTIKNRVILLMVVAMTLAASPTRKTQAILKRADDPPLDISPFYFNFGAEIKSKDPEKNPKGEDALLASKDILGVADGVGAWVLQGIDPSNYSYYLLDNAYTYFYSYPKAYAKNPAKLLILSALTNAYQGTSTMTLCTLYEDDMYTANVGDSGYIILVPTLKNMPKNSGTTFIYDIAFVSEAQQHEYNFPYQLGSTGDDPKTATKGKVHKIGYGTIILTYTDGVSDNLFPYELKAMVNLYVYELKIKHGIQIKDFVPAFDSKEMARRIMERADQKSKDVESISPFQYKALDWGVMWKGGKVDDISIIVAIIMNKESPKKEENDSVEEEI